MVVDGLVLVSCAVVFILWIAIGLRNNRADWGFWVTNCIDGWIRVFCIRYHRLNGKSLDLPETGGAIVVSNHVSGLDPFILISSCRRPLHFLIAKEEYERFGLKWLFKLAGCIPVDRSGRVDKAFREVIRRIKQGEVVALFPHGKIHLDDDEKWAIKPGLRKLVEKVSCPVYPARIEGVKGQGDVFTGMLFRGKVELSVFDVLDSPVFVGREVDHSLGALLLGKPSELL